jgi:signal transduction histidine kinase
MMPPQQPFRLLASGILSLAAGLLPGGAEAAGPAQTGNPITRIARILDPQLVKVEDRVTWLDSQLSTLSQHCEYPLKVGLGFRGSRNAPGGPDPSITLDLGKDFPIETIYLVPAQREFLEDSGIFPKRFTLEVSTREDFGQRTILYTSGNVPHPPPDGIPMSFKARDTARYIRLTVQEGHNKGTLDLFGLSELVVIANGEPVSFGARVAANDGLEVPGIWYPEALTDGRTPLGTWQNGVRPNLEAGDAVMVENNDDTTTWSLQFDSQSPLDRVILFPYQVNRSFEASVFPEKLRIEIAGPDSSAPVTIHEWENPLPGASHMSPLVIPLNGVMAGNLTVKAMSPWVMGDRKIHALSEIEVWSEGHNLAAKRPVTRLSQDLQSNVVNLTDGYTSEKQIIPVGVWLNQLHDRGRIERELGSLRSIHRQLSSRSELNATWGSAVVLGLTFLIPVFIVERRRLMSKEQLDHIRKRIASDLHDDIGSNLGSISLIARTARKDLVRLHGPEEIAEDLGEVETIARESSLAMRDIVWLLERKQDSIGDLVQRMRETANRLLREIHFTVECESSKTAAKLSLDAKRHLFLFYKEAIHNVLKHSQANSVSIRLWDEDDKLALEILDNGVGIPSCESGSTRPITVNKLEDRARVLEGSLQVASSKETGTRVRLLVKRSHLTTHPAMS